MALKFPCPDCGHKNTLGSEGCAACKRSFDTLGVYGFDARERKMALLRLAAAAVGCVFLVIYIYQPLPYPPFMVKLFGLAVLLLMACGFWLYYEYTRFREASSLLLLDRDRLLLAAPYRKPELFSLDGAFFVEGVDSERGRPLFFKEGGSLNLYTDLPGYDELIARLEEVVALRPRGEVLEEAGKNAAQEGFTWRYAYFYPVLLLLGALMCFGLSASIGLYCPERLGSVGLGVTLGLLLCAGIVCSLSLLYTCINYVRLSDRAITARGLFSTTSIGFTEVKAAGWIQALDNSVYGVRGGGKVIYIRPELDRAQGLICAVSVGIGVKSL